MDTSIHMTEHTQAPHGGKLSRLDVTALLFGTVALGMLIHNAVTGSGADHGGGHGDAHAHPPHILSVLPFVGMLLCIAVLPLLASTQHWWESNKNRLVISLCFGATTLTYYLVTQGATKVVTVLEHAVIAEYIPFIILLFALYVISGGISLRGDLAAHPATNTTFLAVGAAIASFIGTTGASMLLIRPLLQTNRERKRVKHTVIFFIFLVSNIGGLLLPIGDPPLFLGYLKGVPFLWTMGLWAPWLMTSLIVLGIYFVWDTIEYRKEEKKDIARDETEKTPLRLEGKLNFLWLGLIVVCVAAIDPAKPLPMTDIHPFLFMRELIMLALVGIALWTTSPRIRKANKFNYHAILEVAALFIGIFICMQAPIEILKASGATLENVFSSPARFFWGTGILSGVLDNAPTYVVFFETASSMTHETGEGTLALLGGGHIDTSMLAAISLGAVFMGAMTYIGNGPNFMVKSIAEQSGVKMPSFFGYMLYSVAILIPVFILVTLLFV